LVPTIFFIVAIVGILANLLVIYIIVILREYKKTVTNLYVVQMAVADFLFLLVLPFQAYYMLVGKWVFGEPWCKMMNCIQMLNYYASILFLMVMSIDRYLAINHAMNSIANKLRSVRAVRLVSIVVWTICFSAVTHILWTAHVLPCDTCAIKFAYDQDQDASEYAYLPLNDSDYAAMDYDYGDGYGSINTTESYQSVEDIINSTPACRIEEKQLKLWLVTNFLVAFFFPLLVIIVCYAHILHKISHL